MNEHCKCPGPNAISPTGCCERCGVQGSEREQAVKNALASRRWQAGADIARERGRQAGFSAGLLEGRRQAIEALVDRELENGLVMAASNHRVLITGSRAWRDQKALADALRPHFQPGAILVSGACEEGADAIAERIWTQLGGEVERHPANWYPDGTFDRTAGFRRNSEMARSGITVCVAAVEQCTKPTCKKPEPHATHGTAHCIGEAKAAGVAVDEIRSGGQREQADRFAYEAGTSFRSGDCVRAVELLGVAEFLDPGRKELWTQRREQVLAKANQMSLDTQIKARLTAAGYTADSKEIAYVRAWNASTRDRELGQ